MTDQLATRLLALYSICTFNPCKGRSKMIFRGDIICIQVTGISWPTILVNLTLTYIGKLISNSMTTFVAVRAPNLRKPTHRHRNFPSTTQCMPHSNGIELQKRILWESVRIQRFFFRLITIIVDHSIGAMIGLDRILVPRLKFNHGDLDVMCPITDPRVTGP